MEQNENTTVVDLPETNPENNQEFNPQYDPQPAAPVHENVLAGIVGAILFSLGGVVLYFLIYQLGFIAGITGLAIVFLAGLGYQIFSGKKYSMKGVVVSIILLVVMILVAEFACLVYELYVAFQAEGYSITLAETVAVTPTFAMDPEVLPSVIKDLLISYALGAWAAFSNIRAAIANSKAEKQRKG